MTPPRRIRRILLIRRRALGDALVTMPAVLAVHRAWPEAAVDLVVDRPFAPLLEDLAAPLRVLAWPPPPGVSWLRQLRAGRYDLVIDWLGNPRTAMWTALSGAPLRVGYDLPRRRWAYNVLVPRNRVGGREVRAFAGEAFLDPLRALGLVPPPWQPGFARGRTGGLGRELGPTYRRWRQDWDPARRRPVAVIMSATWPAKAWPAAHVIALVAQLAAAGREPLVVSGPGDGDLEATLRAGLAPDLFAPPTTLGELADLLSCCRLLVATDCGARHLAAALGVPTVTLFGPTDPGGWNPASPAHVSLRTGVECSPCNLTRCPVPGHPCLDGLDPATVLAAAERLLAGTEPATGR
ncbi:MAG: glycosyltransferase family 9 protein [Candidatus Krumholzibacteriia bacterium]